MFGLGAWAAKACRETRRVGQCSSAPAPSPHLNHSLVRQSEMPESSAWVLNRGTRASFTRKTVSFSRRVALGTKGVDIRLGKWGASILNKYFQTGQWSSRLIILCYPNPRERLKSSLTWTWLCCIRFAALVFNLSVSFPRTQLWRPRKKGRKCRRKCPARRKKTLRFHLSKWIRLAR